MAQSNIAPSAALEVNSTSKGFLPPRMTTLQRDNISSPAQGLVIFNTDTNRLNTYTGSSWVVLLVGVNNSIADTDGDTQLQAEESADEDILRFDTNGTERLRINNSGQVGMGTTTAVATSALLELRSTTQGFLPPRMTSDQRDAITDTATGLLIYNTTTHKINYYTNGEWSDGFRAVLIVQNGLLYDIVKTPTGRYWLDRNLGASRVAQSSTDAQAYGDLYQWGRTTDGHEKRNSSTITSGAVASGNEGSNFVRVTGNWLSTQDDTRWNGAIKGVHDPCPNGFRVPTEAEFEAERLQFSSNNSAGAFASILKLPVAGSRNFSTANIDGAGSYVYYWTSTPNTANPTYINYFFITSTNITSTYTYQAYGMAVRCIKE